jgi:hypothetical protein
VGAELLIEGFKTAGPCLFIGPVLADGETVEVLDESGVDVLLKAVIAGEPVGASSRRA